MRMIFFGLIMLIVVPYLCGTIETMILRERNAGHLNVYVTGLLSLFAYFLFAVLVSLKLDFDFSKLKLIFFIGPSVLGLAGIPFLTYKIKKGYMPGFKKPDKSILWFVPTAICLGVLSFFILEPSYQNDNTWDIVSTTLYTGTYYEYSSFTGQLLEMGLPIFVKIYVIPMFYSVYCAVFKTDMWLIAGLVMPVLIYVLNLCLVYEISGTIYKQEAYRKRATFMCAYLIYMLAGTYLPDIGITATVGYAVLREGYTGYAIAYGIIAPFVLLLLLKGKYVHGAFSAIAFLGLLPLDKFLNLVVLSPVKFSEYLNGAGELAVFYIAAVVVACLLRVMKKERPLIWTLLVPQILVPFYAVRLSEFISDSRKKAGYYIAVGILLLAACNFRPMNDGVYASSIRKDNQELATCLEQLSDKGEIVLWSTESIMGAARRTNPSIKLLYPRSVYTLGLGAFEYEATSEMTLPMVYFMRNKNHVDDYLDIKKSDEAIMTAAIDDGVNCIMLPGNNVRPDVEQLFESWGFNERIPLQGYTAFYKAEKTELRKRYD